MSRIKKALLGRGMQCEGYTLGLLRGSRFCDKGTAKAVGNIMLEMEARGILLTAAAFDHGRFCLLDNDRHEFRLCAPGTCMFCDAERAHEVRV